MSEIWNNKWGNAEEVGFAVRISCPSRLVSPHPFPPLPIVFTHCTEKLLTFQSRRARDHSQRTVFNGHSNTELLEGDSVLYHSLFKLASPQQVLGAFVRDAGLSCK